MDGIVSIFIKDFFTRFTQFSSDKFDDTSLACHAMVNRCCDELPSLVSEFRWRTGTETKCRVCGREQWVRDAPRTAVSLHRPLGKRMKAAVYNLNALEIRCGAVRCCFYRRCADDGGAAQELTLPKLSVDGDPFVPFTPEDVTCELRGVTRGHDHVV